MGGDRGDMSVGCEIHLEKSDKKCYSIGSPRLPLMREVAKIYDF
jgi:hypothetical protein